MVCPFRMIEKKLDNQAFKIVDEMVHNILTHDIFIQDYPECYKTKCPFYKDETCKKVDIAMRGELND